MAKKRLNPSIKRSRTRSGCLTCRDRHMKCDEQQPVCKNCIKSKRKCYRGIRLNFTQYTIYNPERYAVPQQEFKLLDQSITIASLYEHGKQLYEPYLHLHKPEDLRESELQYQQDIYCSFPSMPLMKHETSSNFDNNIIIENYDITNLLLNNDYIADQSFLQQSSRMSTTTVKPSNDQHTNPYKIASPDQEFMYNVDIQMFINLVDKEKYYWILDLFNEMNIWKSIIPDYCLKENEKGDNFLINCLLNCSIKSNVNMNNIINDQLNLWNKLKFKELNMDNFKMFENLFISVVLLLLSFNIKFSRSLIKFNGFNKNLINNQIKIFNKLILKFNDSNLRKHKSIVLISSIHSIIILKYLVIKQIESELLKKDELERNSQKHYYRHEGVSTGIEVVTEKLFKDKNYEDDYIDDSNEDENENDEGDIQEILEEDIIYNDSPYLNDLLKLNKFEMINLSQSFKNFDFHQLNYNFKVDLNLQSDSLKLREFVWYLIKLNYIIRHPNNKLIEIDYNFIFNDNNLILPDSSHGRPSSIYSTNISPSHESGQLNHHLIILPNERGIAINLIREYINKLINLSNIEIINASNNKIRQIFKIISDSILEYEIRELWSTNFNWTLANFTGNYVDTK